MRTAKRLSDKEICRSAIHFKFIITMLSLIAVAMHADAQKKILHTPDLSSPTSIKMWELDGSGEWVVSKRMLILTKAGIPAGPIRRPAALAIYKSDLFTTVTVEANIRCRVPVDTVRRDLDVIVGYESSTRFYYVHLSATSDNVHNGIFLVNDANRVRIDAGGSEPQLKDMKWHHVRIVRDGRSGRIEVYVDKGRKPVLTAVDNTISAGRVGFGSFDDTGEFRNIAISAFHE